MLPKSCPLKENLVPSLKDTKLPANSSTCPLSPPRPSLRIIAQWKEMPSIALLPNLIGLWRTRDYFHPE